MRHFDWPLNDTMRVWQEGDIHTVTLVVRVGDERLGKDGKRRRRMDVVGFNTDKGVQTAVAGFVDSPESRGY